MKMGWNYFLVDFKLLGDASTANIWVYILDFIDIFDDGPAYEKCFLNIKNTGTISTKPKLFVLGPIFATWLVFCLYWSKIAKCNKFSLCWLPSEPYLMINTLFINILFILSYIHHDISLQSSNKNIMDFSFLNHVIFNKVFK